MTIVDDAALLALEAEAVTLTEAADAAADRMEEDKVVDRANSAVYAAWARLAEVRASGLPGLQAKARVVLARVDAGELDLDDVGPIGPVILSLLQDAVRLGSAAGEG